MISEKVGNRGLKHPGSLAFTVNSIVAASTVKKSGILKNKGDTTTPPTTLFGLGSFNLLEHFHEVLVGSVQSCSKNPKQVF